MVNTDRINVCSACMFVYMYVYLLSSPPTSFSTRRGSRVGSAPAGVRYTQAIEWYRCGMNANTFGTRRIYICLCVLPPSMQMTLLQRMCVSRPPHKNPPTFSRRKIGTGKRHQLTSSHSVFSFLQYDLLCLPETDKAMLHVESNELMRRESEACNCPVSHLLE